MLHCIIHDSHVKFKLLVIAMGNNMGTGAEVTLGIYTGKQQSFLSGHSTVLIVWLTVCCLGSSRGDNSQGRNKSIFAHHLPVPLLFLSLFHPDTCALFKQSKVHSLKSMAQLHLGRVRHHFAS